ncbi:T9SS type A sorting domain-containing protein [Flammeovirga aprica]|uniref:T9SS type A sorting domain-containing protein n=1 Tax=Flammeovirga aprica JL-4 TaxID=694437 RepID=A0A7X9RW78_9BACT|nr:T9SS type A sorting domain-containing protein [Flammeovirga aprica]NME69774.1 T9SS type A sorting domain-containing protein [Flammeovirga aprica JL-4]
MKTIIMNMKCSFFYSILFLLFISFSSYSQPYFQQGNDPIPAGKTWEKRENLSDDFSSSSLNSSKWKNTDPTRWVGRAPGLFKENTVSINSGNLCITNYKLSSPEIVNGTTFTHACGHVISQNKVTVGDFIECRMKANKTFLSSTFWLINYKNEGAGCDKRVTELDIQECVGYVNSTASWTQGFDQSMHSNTHSRNVSCGEPQGSNGNNTKMSGKVYDDYHVYGAWWKSADEILFYLDGVYQYTVTPAAPFDIDMYIKLVTETYDWNPTPSDGGMNGSWEDRTTKYDWVRTWKLSDSSTETVSLYNPPMTITPKNTYDVEVSYYANTSRDIVVEMWSGNSWLASAKETVVAGSGIKKLTLNLNNLPVEGNDYSWKVSIRPVGTDWTQNIDNETVSNVVVKSGPILPNGTYEIRSIANGYNLGATNWANWDAVDVIPDNYNDQRWTIDHLYDDIYTIKLYATWDGDKYLEVPNAQCNNGALVSTYSQASANHQRWRIEANGNSYNIVPVHCTSQALDVRPDDNKLHIWSKNLDNDNQKWNFILDNSRTANNLSIQSYTASDILVYPNPTKDYLNIDLPDGEYSLGIYNSTGEIELEQNIINPSKVNVSDLQPGIYILKVKSPYMLYKFNFLKQ